MHTECGPDCDEGHRRCYRDTDTQCCHYYRADDLCYDMCQENATPDDNFDCVCDGFLVGLDCSGQFNAV